MAPSRVWTLLVACLCGPCLGRLVSVADLHGDFDHAVNILSSAKLIDKETQKWIGGDATLVQTGDITDRGDHCKQIYELFFRLRKEAEEVGGRVINVLGNHEVMNMQGDWRYVSQGDVDEFGGMEERKQAWAWDGWLGSEVQKFPVAVVVDRVLFVHAGLLPEMLDHRTLEELNVAFHGALKHASTSKHMKKDEPKLLGGHGPVWARDYAYGRSNICQLAQQVLQKVDADRMVVGHTIQRDFQVHSKCHGQIILGDTAISSAYGGAMSFIEYDGSEVKARYPGSEAIVALPEVGLPDVTSGDVQRGSGMAWPVLVIIGLLVVAIWRCFSCRKPRTT